MLKQTKNKIIYEENINNLKSKALAYAIPESISEVQTLIKTNSKITSRGSGTSFVAGATPNNSLVIDTSKLNHIIDINSGKKTVLVEAGVILSELNKALEKYDLEFPVETIFSGIETIGGVLAKNSSGSREIKYNKVMNWVASIEIINARGEVAKVPKSDMSDFVGMEGTTGFIARATLRLTNKKTRTISILKSSNLSDIFKANSKLRLNQYICAIDFLDKDISVLLGLEKKYHLLVEYENEEGMFKDSQYYNYFNLKNQAYKKIAGEGYYLVESVKIFQESIEDFVIYLEENNIPFFSHLSSGVFYICFRPEQKEKRIEALLFTKKLNGKVSYNSGFGKTNKEFIEKSDLEIIKRVKKRQDPNFKFNEGVLVDDINLEKSIKQKFKDEQEPQYSESQETKVEEEQEQQAQDILNEVQEQEIKEALGEQQEVEEQPEQKEVEEKLIEINRDEFEEPIIQTVNVLTQKPKTELSDEEKEKVKKLASGFFGGTPDSEDN